MGQLGLSLGPGESGAKPRMSRRLGVWRKGSHLELVKRAPGSQERATKMPSRPRSSAIHSRGSVSGRRDRSLQRWYWGAYEGTNTFAHMPGRFRSGRGGGRRGGIGGPRSFVRARSAMISSPIWRMSKGVGTRFCRPGRPTTGSAICLATSRGNVLITEQIAVKKISPVSAPPENCRKRRVAIWRYAVCCGFELIEGSEVFVFALLPAGSVVLAIGLSPSV